jgi:hypothetical protein
MRLLRVRLTVRWTIAAVAFLVVLGALTDVFINHRRVVRLRAAWAYDTQDRECHRLAEAYSREAVRQEREAEHCPEGSERRETRLEAASFYHSQRAGVLQVGAAAHEMAKHLRRLARVEQ